MEHTPGPDDPRVRERAYQLWEQEGRPDDRHLDHWAQAVRDIEEEDRRNGGGPRVTGPDAGLAVPDDAAARNQREAAQHLGQSALPSDG
ncbi:hypothetical protein VY88_06025 [Azospirillum thiophilum]|uniref:DUF2934 domain-containing protein n=1 Tax=Azospirillum thiophilum TaxID=528244 RepID=A0AAC8VW71_9PROT|nr:DUF2934 domain-containing protein [Azospirillum thiophilum]ALG70647.1 hypothetical protein AL072_06685 [Azospirillum thiophilum]KJR65683.1 hypothetical protein VY88_06025 [Azospirillum thiophilum]